MYMKYGVMFTTVLCVYVGGCSSSQPGEPPAAGGAVTISTPVLTPITSAVQDADRLDFGTLKSEATIADMLQRPNVSVSQLRSVSSSAALALNLAGPQLSSNTTSTVSTPAAPSDATTVTRTKTFKSPEVPTVPTPPTPTGQDALAGQLGAGTNTFYLPPDRIADLVASIKTHMVNLESFYNLSDYSNLYKGNSPWLPYRLHFLVTVDPPAGVDISRYDAIADIELSPTDGRGSDYFRVLAVMPTEAAQALDELAAAYRSFSGSLQVGGAFQAVALGAAFQRAQAAADRLEGLRTNTSFVASYPAPNKIRIRFRPTVVPTTQKQDFQPTSKQFTAMVLVRENIAAVAAGTPSAMTTNATRSSLLPQRLINDLPKLNQSPQGKRFPARSILSAGEDPTRLQSASGECKVSLTSRFEAAGQPARGSSHDRSSAPNASTGSAGGGAEALVLQTVIPKWPEEAVAPLSIDDASGFYWKDQNNTFKAAVALSITNLFDGVPASIRFVGTADERTGEFTIDESGSHQAVQIVSIHPPDVEGGTVNVFVAVKAGDSTLVRAVAVQPQTQGSPATGASLTLKGGQVEGTLPPTMRSDQAIEILRSQRPADTNPSKKP